MAIGTGAGLARKQEERRILWPSSSKLTTATYHLPQSDIVLFRVEKSKLEESSAALNDRVQKLQEAQRGAQANTAHRERLKQLGPLEDQVKRLTSEKDSWENAAAGGVEGVKADIAKAKEDTSRLVDNIDTIEGQLQSLLNGDKAAMEPIRQYCYGALYIEGEGLPELEGL